jgi:hypothetical protein
MGPNRNPRWEQKRTEGYVIVSRLLALQKRLATPLKVTVTVTSLLYATLRHLLIHINIQISIFKYTKIRHIRLRFGPIQRNGTAPGVIHTGRFFVLIPLKWLEKLTGVKDKYI